MILGPEWGTGVLSVFKGANLWIPYQTPLPPNGDSPHHFQRSKIWEIGSRAPGPRRRQHIQLQGHNAGIGRWYIHYRHSLITAPAVHPHSFPSIVRYGQVWGYSSVIGGLLACPCFVDPGSTSRGIRCNCRVSLPLLSRMICLRRECSAFWPMSTWPSVTPPSMSSSSRAALLLETNMSFH